MIELLKYGSDHFRSFGLIPYTGNKNELLPFIASKIPGDYSRFVDVFCGGLSVAMRIPGSVIANDNCNQLITMYRAIASLENPVDDMFAIATQYGLSRDNKDGYYALRDEYNRTGDPLLLWWLTTCSFSSVMRFNAGGKFNVPFGHRFPADRAKNRLQQMVERRLHGRISFTCEDFRNIQFLKGDFAYFDPPYLCCAAAYNSGWGEKEEKDLYNLLEKLHARGIEWGLSNSLSNKGVDNNILKDWLNSHPEFNVYTPQRLYYFDRMKRSEKEDNVEVYVTNVPENRQCLEKMPELI